MPGPIEFWFDFASPYGYFAAIEVERRLARFDRPILWRPFLLGVAFRQTGMAALTSTPLRGAYALRDWERIGTMLGVPFRMPENHPFGAQALSRAFYWFVDNKPDHAVPFAKAAYSACFGRGEDVSGPEQAIALAADHLEDTGDLARWLASQEAKQALKDKTDEALEKGVFGSPTFIADDESFFGWDRLWMLETWLTHGDWRKAGTARM